MPMRGRVLLPRAAPAISGAGPPAWAARLDTRRVYIPGTPALHSGPEW